MPALILWRTRCTSGYWRGALRVSGQGGAAYGALSHTPKERFDPVDTPKNRRLAEQVRDDDKLVAWRTTGNYWGKERTVVVTYNPLTATKQHYAFERRLSTLSK
jgi:hypothetical protein